MEDNHNRSDFPVCPYCSYDNRDAITDLHGDESELYCGECGKTFTVTREVEITFTTSKIEEHEDEFYGNTAVCDLCNENFDPTESTCDDICDECAENEYAATIDTD